jgi:WD40 repeat protein
MTAKFFSWFGGVVVFGELLAGGIVANSKAADAPKVTYTDHVQPILRQKCFSCHNPDKKSGGLDMTNFTALMAGGSSGEAIEPGNSGASYLWRLVTHESEPKMPPNSEKIPAEMLAVIGKWIDGGALDNASSKALASKKPKIDLKLAAAPTQRPEGPPPMPERLSLAPVIKTKTTTAITSLAVNPWSPLAAVPGQKQVLLYNTTTLELLGVLPYPEGIPQVLKFSRSGSLLMAAGGHAAAQGKVVIFNVRTGERVAEVGDELDTVLAADISPDQSLIALGGSAKMIRVYSIADGSKLWESKKHTDWVTSLAFAPDSVLLATGDRNGGVFVWEAETGREFHTLKAHTAMITGFSWRLDSNILASCSEDTTVRLWEMENGGNVKGWGAHGAGASSVDFARDGRIISAGRDRVVKIWDQNGTAVRAFEAMADLALACAICNETNRVIGADWTGAIRVWNAVDGAKIGDLTPNPPTLEERLAAANAAVQATTAEAKVATDGYAAAQAAANKAKADLTAANTKMTELTKVVTDTSAAVVKGKEAIVAAQAAHDAAAKVVATLDPVVPALTDSVAKGTEAAAKNADDKEIAAAVTALKALLDNRATTLANNKKVVADKVVELTKGKEQLVAQEKLITDTNVALEAVKKTIPDLTVADKTMTEKAVAAKAVADAATAKLASAQKDVARWTAEIDFATKLKGLAEKKALAEPLVAAADEAQAAVNKVKADIAAAQQVVATSQRGVDDANAAVNTAKQALTTATNEHQTITTNVAALEAALPALKEAHAKGAEAAAKAPNDKELAAAAESLKTVLDKQTANLTTAKTMLAEKAAVVEKAKVVVAEMEKKAAAAVAVLTTANAKVSELTAAMKPVEDKFASAKQAADQALQPVTALQQEIQKLKEVKL